MAELRIEQDSMGPVEVPVEALYGASTQRAVENFPLSGVPVDRRIIHAYGQIKAAAAAANRELGLLPAALAETIVAAANEVAAGVHDAHFPVDTYQTGSGTSTNMNVNEVIARRCAALGAPEVHPNDHVNHGQSSNDTFPSAIHLAAAAAIAHELAPALESLQQSLAAKAAEFHPVLKIGRTHLMDAVPMRLGDEFSGYAEQARRAVGRARAALECLLELPLGGTAVGTGLNRHKDFPRLAITMLAAATGLPLRAAANPFEAQAARDAIVEAHGQLNTIAVSLHKIAGDLRLLASGPHCALGEITLPALQPGSSIMPGKVNPVMCEALTMVAARVAGNQTTVTWGAANGQLELNTYMPVMASALLESIHLLARGARLFADKCVVGIRANPERCAGLIEASMAMVTALVPTLGYARAAQLAHQAVARNISIRQLCTEQLDELGITRAELDRLLDPTSMADGSRPR